MRFVELYIGAVILWSVFYKIGLLIFKQKESIKKVWILTVILVFSLILALINNVKFDAISEIIKMIVVYGLMLLFNRALYQNSYDEIIIGSGILFLSYVISEVTIALFLSIIMFFTYGDPLKLLQNTILVNFLITICAYSTVVRGKKKFLMIIKENKYSSKSNIIIISVILLTAILLLVRIPVSRWQFNIEFIFTMLILSCFCIIGFLMLKQKADIQKTTAMYQQLVDYSDITNNLLEEYRVISHEQKNHLLIIRGMLDETNKELVDYVDNLLDKQVGFKYEWIGDLNHLPLSGLKGLINYKLIEMEALGIATDVSISKEVLKTKLNKLSTKQKDNLYSIMGVYLDNAIQAAKDSKKKEISLEVYKEKKNIIIVLANTYKGKIELDKLDNYGYSTKGKNRGVGLHIVKRIIEEETIFTQSRDLFDEYYIQKLVINLYQIKGK